MIKFITVVDAYYKTKAVKYEGRVFVLKIVRLIMKLCNNVSLLPNSRIHSYSLKFRKNLLNAAKS